MGLVEQLPFCLELQAALQGRLDHKPAFERYELNVTFRGTTPRVFADDALLLPGERTTFEPIVLRTRFHDQAVRLWYQEFSFPVLLSNAYFPQENSRPAAKLMYTHVPFSGLREYRAAQPGTLGRTVLVPRVEALGDVITYTAELELAIGGDEDAGEIVAAAGASTASSVTRWLGAGLWVVDDPIAERTFAFTDAKERRELPRCDLVAFDLFDAVSPPAVTAFQPDGRRVELTSVAEIERWLEAARGAGQQVLVEVLEDSGGAPYAVLALAPDPASELGDDAPDAADSEPTDAAPDPAAPAATGEEQPDATPGSIRGRRRD